MHWVCYLQYYSSSADLSIYQSYPTSSATWRPRMPSDSPWDRHPSYTRPCQGWVPFPSRSALQLTDLESPRHRGPSTSVDNTWADRLNLLVWPVWHPTCNQYMRSGFLQQHSCLRSMDRQQRSCARSMDWQQCSCACSMDWQWAGWWVGWFSARHHRVQSPQ